MGIVKIKKSDGTFSSDLISPEISQVGNNNIIVKCGYSVLNGNGSNYIPFMSEETIKTHLGFSDPTENHFQFNTCLFVMNQNADHQDAHSIAAEYYVFKRWNNQSFNYTWFIRADRNIINPNKQTNIAVTWMLIYFSNEGATPGIYVKENNSIKNIATAYGFQGNNGVIYYPNQWIKTGTGSNSFTLMNLSKMDSCIGQLPDQGGHVLMLVNNAAGTDNPAHFDGVSYVPSSREWKIIFQDGQKPTAAMRINFATIRWDAFTQKDKIIINNKEYVKESDFKNLVKIVCGSKVCNMRDGKTSFPLFSTTELKELLGFTPANNRALIVVSNGDGDAAQYPMSQGTTYDGGYIYCVSPLAATSNNSIRINYMIMAMKNINLDL